MTMVNTQINKELIFANLPVSNQKKSNWFLYLVLLWFYMKLAVW